MSGFVDGEGHFSVGIYKSKSARSGYNVTLLFKVTQHVRDIEVMQGLVNFLNCGNVAPRPDKCAVDFQVFKFSDIIEKVIPFFKEYPLQGAKSKDFADFCKIAELMKNKAHLTEEGLNQIRLIKAGMNRGRID